MIEKVMGIVREAGGFVGTTGSGSVVLNRPIPLICANTAENYEYLHGVVTEEIPQVPYED